ncbi:RNA polymerase sigma factor [Armatimonas rosea]|uniref:RNA polymerase sigma factor n=1 Tax=Armatimonas rosea TaxID=685828 RepID=A0A7W9WA75_ARMRO|nr:RNA polymerase sigma factor [Armatimonas rosea]MBB6054000.1 RNA polymerase sigma-70 factor (ECF subfamily) [Armatimonas rosea]
MKHSPEDVPSFSCLYERYGRDVLGVLLRLTNGDRAEAEDLTQETFLAAFKGQKNFSGRVPFRAWLVGIAARRWRDSRRRPKPATTPLTEDPPSVVLMDRAITDRVALVSALGQLPDDQQTAVLLVLGQGLTYREAAEALGVPSGTLKWRVTEALRRLRPLLTDEGESQ